MPANGSQPSRILPTAYSLIVLNRYSTWRCGTTAIANVLSNGAAWLKSQQKTPGGGFGEGTGGTVMETVLAWRALTTVLGASDPAVISAQNFLITRQQADGSWNGGDSLSTMLTLAAMPVTTLADTDNDGLPDGTETTALLGTSPTLPDAFGLLAGNGRSRVGETTAIALANAVIDVPYSARLAASGAPPHNWVLSSGELPDGLSLDSTSGQITGTPTALGVFSFSYDVLAANRQTTVLSRIEVIAEPPVSHEVPALPLWATLLMGGLLFFIMRQGGPARVCKPCQH